MLELFLQESSFTWVGLTLLAITLGACLFLVFSSSDEDVRLTQKLQILSSVVELNKVELYKKDGKEDRIYQQEDDSFLGKYSSHIEGRLRNAGSDLSVLNFLLALVMVGVVVALLTVTFLGVSWWLAAILVLVVMGLAGFWFLSHLDNRMREEFITGFPSTLDMIARGTRAGLPIADQIRTVGSSVPGIIGRVFRQITAGVNMGLSLAQSLREVNQKIDITEFNFFTIAVIIQQQTGSSLHQTLGNLASMGRKRLEMRDKVRAQSSGAKGSAYIVGALPLFVPLTMSIMNPNYYGDFFTNPLDNTMLMVAITLYVLGIVSIKMILRERF